ncbi:DUF1963 domain-containing protein [Streptomyces sp. NPDC056661]|uniref:DUF1963 domain-containing protein n=1 Tax=Streptomyces sp. NPDC056661 TaxID=3345898 RepID=UPI00367AF056
MSQSVGAALLRPAVRLEAARAADIAVGQIGGLPQLSADVEWPSREGHGPHSFIASVDCTSLRVGALDIMLPIEGTLSFFYFGGQLDDGEALVLADDCESSAGACVLYTPAEEECGERDAPAGLQPYPKVPLTTLLGLTTAEPWHPQVRDACAPGAPLWNRYDHSVRSQEFLDALPEFDTEVGHHIGGRAHSVQNPVDIEVAGAVMAGRCPRATWPSITRPATGRCSLSSTVTMPPT